MSADREQPEIQLWNAWGEPIAINEGIDETAMRVTVAQPQALPPALQEEIDANWRAVKKKNPKAQSNPVTFYAQQAKENDGEIVIGTEERGFKDIAAFNRNEDFHGRTDELRDHRLLHVSTHAHILTSDGHLLYGTKKNQFNQVSGFGGFPQLATEAVELEDGERVVDLRKCLVGRVQGEIGELTDAIGRIDATGITYVGRPALRGTDMNFLLHVDATADEAARVFNAGVSQGNDQFSKGLYKVALDGKEMRDFVKAMHTPGADLSRYATASAPTVHPEGGQMSPYAMGCMAINTRLFLGEEEAERFEQTVREDAGVSIGRGNSTDYFAEPQEE